jgi:hypothetical protein
VNVLRLLLRLALLPPDGFTFVVDADGAVILDAFSFAVCA